MLSRRSHQLTVICTKHAITLALKGDPGGDTTQLRNDDRQAAGRQAGTPGTDPSFLWLHSKAEDQMSGHHLITAPAHVLPTTPSPVYT